MINHLTLATTELHSKKISNFLEFHKKSRGPKWPDNIDHMVKKNHGTYPWCFDSQWEYRDLARFLASGFVQDKNKKSTNIMKWFEFPDQGSVGRDESSWDGALSQTKSLEY